MANPFKIIREVAEILDIPATILRYWETEFTMQRPNQAGGQRRGTGDEYNSERAIMSHFTLVG